MFIYIIIGVLIIISAAVVVILQNRTTQSKKTIQQIHIFKQQQKWSQLIKTCKKFTEYSSVNPLPYYALALAYKKKGHYVKAYENLRYILHNSLQNNEVTEKDLYRELAAVAGILEKTDEQIKYNTLLTKTEDDNAAHYYELGNSYYQAQNWQQAAKTLEKCLVLDKNFTKAFVLLGTAYFKMRNENKALQYLRAAVHTHCNDPEIPFMLAEIYYNKRDYNNAVTYYRQSIKNNCHAAECNAKLGFIFCAQKEYTQGEKYLQTALEQFKKDKEENNSLSRVKIELANTTARRGDLDTALKYWREADKNTPEYRQQYIDAKIQTFSYIKKYQQKNELSKVYFLNNNDFKNCCLQFLRKLKHYSLAEPVMQNETVTVKSIFRSGVDEYDCLTLFDRNLIPVTKEEMKKLLQRIKEEKIYMGIYLTWYVFSEDAHEYAKTVPIELYDGAKTASVIQR
ncbi:MAG TPA: tetratricopeptide repeat protein [Spirochaetota bacterium]|nr:tetratricopeptide repeat protein [Spirochaetota bacterium]